MQHLEFKRTLKTFIDQSNLESKLLTTLRTIPDIAELRLNLELTLHVCKCIEVEVNYIPPSKKPDKLALLIKIMDSLFSLTEQEQKLLTSQVEILHSMKKIKGVSTYKIIGNYIGNWIVKKLL